MIIAAESTIHLCGIIILMQLIQSVDMNGHVYHQGQMTPRGGELPINGLMGMCRWMGSHFHDWTDYNGVAFSSIFYRVTRMGSHFCGILRVRNSGKL